MMGAGKSTLGQALAGLAGREFDDTDALLERKLGRTATQLFRLYGEDAFRTHETCLLRSLEPGLRVLATGGGIVLREENWRELHRLGTTIYLRADVQTLIDRLGRSKRKRPLLEVQDWEEKLARLLEARRPLYEQADVTVDVDDAEELEEAAKRLLDVLRGARGA